jgi:hypothetical protein
MRILAIDPGTNQSGFVIVDNATGVVDSDIVDNDVALALVKSCAHGRAAQRLAIEMIASYGMPVGAEVFETVRWIGRFEECWWANREPTLQGAAELIYRRDVKLHLCGSPKAKDPNIRQALLDLVGPQGTKKSPGPTYGVKSHAWAALAVAATALNLQPKARAA